MTRVNLLLGLVLVASGLYLVKTTHESRTLFAAVDRARTEEARLETDLKRLEAERQQQATTQRVERSARDRLQMRPANPAVTQYVQDPSGPGSTATAAATGTKASASTTPSTATGSAR